MDKQTEQPSSGDVSLAITQLAGIHEKIARSFDGLEKLYAEEVKRREEEHKERIAWMQGSEEKAARSLEEMKKSQALHIPWQITGVWCLVILVLTLAAVLFLIEIYKQWFTTLPGSKL